MKDWVMDFVGVMKTKIFFSEPEADRYGASFFISRNEYIYFSRNKRGNPVLRTFGIWAV